TSSSNLRTCLPATRGVRAYKQRGSAVSRLPRLLPQIARLTRGGSKSLYVKQLSLRTRAGQLSAGADVRPFAGPPLPRLEQRDAWRRAAACERPHAAQRKNVGRTESPLSVSTSERAMNRIAAAERRVREIV